MPTFTITVVVPSMGATVNELTVIDIRVRAGDTIKKGQHIAELESDKSVFEYEAPCDGTIEAVVARAGDIIATGMPFLRIHTSDESLRHLQTPSDTPVAVPTPASAAPIAVRPTAAPTPLPVAAPSSTTSAGHLTPRAAKLLSDAGLSPAAVAHLRGTGPGGRLSGEDISAFLLSTQSGSTPAATTTTASATQYDAQTVCVAGVGYAVPANIRSNSEILRAFPNMTEDEVIKLTGIRERRYAGPDESATSLAAQAVSQALAQAGISVDQIDGIIMATLIPDQPVPSAASALARHMGIKKALAFDLNAACAGWLYALEVGRAFIRSGTARCLIVVTAELLSRITNPRDHATAFLFGDGAGAAILTDAPGGHRLHLLHLTGDAENFSAISRVGGGARQLIPSADGHNLDDFYIKMDGAVVFKNAVRAFADLIEGTLARHQLRPQDIAWVVPHQANERILRAVSKRVDIPYERFVVTIGKYGNTSAASVSMALGWAAQEQIFKPGDKIIFCSVGAGFTFAGGLLVW